MDTQPSQKIPVRYFPRYSIYKKVYFNYIYGNLLHQKKKERGLTELQETIIAMGMDYLPIEYRIDLKSVLWMC